MGGDLRRRISRLAAGDQAGKLRLRILWLGSHFPPDDCRRRRARICRGGVDKWRLASAERAPPPRLGGSAVTEPFILNVRPPQDETVLAGVAAYYLLLICPHFLSFGAGVPVPSVRLLVCCLFF